MNFKTVIGLEIHVQLFTKSKIFCNCSTAFGSEPNIQTCPVCLGLPGTLPVLNEESLNLALKVAVALNCEIAEKIKFDRKNYFYPDLPKGYQISQFDMPLAKNGELYIISSTDKSLKKVGITRTHLEEDAGKLLHKEGNYSLVDFNRTGVPLLEIVTEPDINSPEEAYDFLSRLKSILKYLEVSDCNMEEGSLRCDANISVQPEDSDKKGVKSEIKNMNSFKGVRDALQYESDRQIKQIKKGDRVVQETRLWDETEKVTMPMRSKEEAHDYRYFPEPDLVYFEISKDKIDEIKSVMPELPDKRKKRFIEKFNIPEYDAAILTSERSIADFFDACALKINDYKLISNWIMGQLMEILNEKKIKLSELAISIEHFVELLKMVSGNKINSSIAKDVFTEMVESKKSPGRIVEEKGLAQISNEDELQSIVENVVKSNQKSVDDYKSGRKNALMYLVGQVMRETKGKANPKIVNEMLRGVLEK